MDDKKSSVATVSARKLKGFQDHAPRSCESRQTIVTALRNEAQLRCFVEIATPALEYADVLLGSSNAETDKEVYRFTDHGERDVALRFDLTVPFARYVAEHQGTLVTPFRKLQIGEVWRGEKPQKGRYRQFCQADFDIVGTENRQADLEVIDSILSVCRKVIPAPHAMALNHRGIISGLIRKFFPQNATQCEAALLIALDKLHKIGAPKVTAMITETTKDAVAADEFMNLLNLQDTSDSGRDTQASEIGHTLLGDPAATSALDDLRWVWEELRSLAESRNLEDRGDAEQSIEMDFSLARGLGYYTGVVFETTITSLPGFGSVSSGGRYDQLVSRFTPRSWPGVGGSIGVDRLVAALADLSSPTAADGWRPSLFIAFPEGHSACLRYGLHLADAMRSQGHPAETSTKPGKIPQQLKYAARRQHRFAIAIGDQEVSTKVFRMKNLQDNTEHLLQSETELLNFFAAL